MAKLAYIRKLQGGGHVAQCPIVGDANDYVDSNCKIE